MRCHPVPPNVMDSLQAYSMAKLDSLVLVRTLASLYSPGFHCQPVPKLRTLLALHPLRSLDPTHLVVGPVSTVEDTSGKEATFIVSSRPGSLGQASCFSGPPLGSLNYLYARRGKLHDVDNPREVSGIPTHEIFTLLLLVVIHGLRHLHRQPSM